MSSNKANFASFSPTQFSISDAVKLTVTGGTNFANTGSHLWFQFRDADSPSVDPKTVPSYKPDSITQKGQTYEATFVVPAGSFVPNAASYQLWVGTTSSTTEIPAYEDWLSNPNAPQAIIYQLTSGVGTTIPVQGGTNCIVGIFGIPDGTDGATVTLVPDTKNLRTKSWHDANAKPENIVIAASVQVTNSRNQQGLIHWTSPLIPFEGTVCSLYHAMLLSSLSCRSLQHHSPVEEQGQRRAASDFGSPRPRNHHLRSDTWISFGNDRTLYSNNDFDVFFHRNRSCSRHAIRSGKHISRLFVVRVVLTLFHIGHS